MKHIFDVEIAVEYGVNAAILLENIGYWIEKNEANGVHWHDGCYWTYSSVRAFGIQFPYMGKKSIANALKKLEAAELIKTGNFNKMVFDQTTWYALTQKGNSLLQNGKCQLPKRGNVNVQKGEMSMTQKGKPIPDIKPNIITDKKTDIETRKRFTPPTAEEVKAYADEINAVIDAERFVDFYASKGWLVGKSPMRDWKAAVRNWAKKDKPQKVEREMVDVGGGEMIPW